MIRRKISVACLQEIIYVRVKPKGIDNTGNKIYYSRKDRHINGMGIIVTKCLKDNVVTVVTKRSR